MVDQQRINEIVRFYDQFSDEERRHIKSFPSTRGPLDSDKLAKPLNISRFLMCFGKGLGHSLLGNVAPFSLLLYLAYIAEHAPVLLDHNSCLFNKIIKG